MHPTSEFDGSEIATLAEGWDHVLRFGINGAVVEINLIDSTTTLLDYLRGIGLTGTKLGCGEGGCGACTVVVCEYNGPLLPHTYTSVVACLTSLVAMDGKHIITTEYLASTSEPHVIQKRIAEKHGSQCGFCSPGMVMSLFAFYQNNPNPTDEEIEEALDGNLCRCTGYRPILDAARSLKGSGALGLNGGCCMAQDEHGNLPAGCCKNKPNIDEDTSNTSVKEFTLPVFTKHGPDARLIFPWALRKHGLKDLALGRRCYRPMSLEWVLLVKDRAPGVALIAGSTGTKIQAEITGENNLRKICLFIGSLAELREVTFEDTYLMIGANITLTELEKILKEAIEHYGTQKSQPFEALLKQLKVIASLQVKNTGTVAGNLAIAFPSSDLATFFAASQSILLYRVYGKDEPIEIKMSEFFTGRGTCKLPEKGVIVALHIPVTGKDEEKEFMRMYKQGKRKHLDAAIVNAGFRVSLDEDKKVKSIDLVYGGMTKPATQATNTMEYLMAIDKEWDNPEVLEGAMTHLEKDFPSCNATEVEMPVYKKALALGFFYRFWNEVTGILNGEIDHDLVDEIERKVSSGNAASVEDLPHVAALKQTTGEAQYTDDIPTQKGELYGCLVLSTHPRARIKVDYEPALKMPGVVAYADHNDLPKPDSNDPKHDPNMWGAGEHDEPFFAVDEVFTQGQPIGIVLAETQKQAVDGAAEVAVDYRDEGLTPILTIEEAIKQKSFFEPHRELAYGECIEEALKKADHRIKGVTQIGGQEHFYLETNAVVVVPKPEDGEIEVFSSTQNPSETQKFVAQVTGVPVNRVIARVRRLGGGFGGKESRSIQLAAICAVAAKKTKRPVRCMLSRDEDMITSGQRHPFLAEWTVGVTDNWNEKEKEKGKIVALKADVYSHGGWSKDLSITICERALAHIDNCYKIPNVKICGKVCKTNTMSNTAFRGFGGPQGLFIAESYIEEIADHLGMPPDMVREVNMYKEGEKTHFDQELKDWYVPKLVKTLKCEAGYQERRRAVDEFNKKFKYKKRGLSLIPTKFGISFTATSLNQAGALVHIYRDGSILIAHGGTEMGQGLHTKMLMVAAKTLNVPIESISISETATNTVANTSPTSGSTASDLNGFAIFRACEKLNRRLELYRARCPTMKEAVEAAYQDRINLSANGFYRTPEVGYSWDTGKGQMFYYFTQGASFAEVEIDTLTGDWTCREAHVKMDIGRSINSAIDYGQIQGAFLQGQGLFTTEESLWGKDGLLKTLGPGKYKIPAARDIPQVFNITTLDGVEWGNLHTIYSSKGVGEPPLFLGSTVFFAIRDALKSVRKDNGVTGTFSLPSPATPELIRLSCGDKMILGRIPEAAL